MSRVNVAGRKGLPQPKKTSAAASRKAAAASSSGMTPVPAFSIGGSLVFPARLKKTFTSSGLFTLTGDGVGTLQKATLSLNSLYDPNYSGTGTVPRYFNTLLGADDGVTPYGRYQVVCARLRAVFMSQSAANTSLGDVGLYVRNENSTALETADQMYESEYTVTRPIGSGYSDNGTVTMSYEFSSRLFAHMLSCKDLEDTAENVGTYTSDPSTEIIADLMFLPFISTSVAVINVRWVLEQDAILTRVQEQLPNLDAQKMRANRKAANASSHAKEAKASSKIGGEAVGSTTAPPPVAVGRASCLCGNAHCGNHLVKN